MHKLWWTWGFELNFDPSEDCEEKFSVFNISFLPWLHILCVGDYSFCSVLSSPWSHFLAIPAMPWNPSWSVKFSKRHWLNIILCIHFVRILTFSFPFHPFTTKHIPLTRRRDVSVLRKREKHISRRENGKEITITASPPTSKTLFVSLSAQQPESVNHPPQSPTYRYSVHIQIANTRWYMYTYYIYIFLKSQKIECPSANIATMAILFVFSIASIPTTIRKILLHHRHIYTIIHIYEHTTHILQWRVLGGQGRMDGRRLRRRRRQRWGYIYVYNTHKYI